MFEVIDAMLFKIKSTLLFYETVLSNVVQIDKLLLYLLELRQTVSIKAGLYLSIRLNPSK